MSISDTFDTYVEGQKMHFFQICVYMCLVGGRGEVNIRLEHLINMYAINSDDEDAFLIAIHCIVHISATSVQLRRHHLVSSRWWAIHKHSMLRGL